MNDVEIFNQRQVWFDTATRKLFEQGGPSMAPGGGGCVYSTPTGRGCAVGVLLSDEEKAFLIQNNLNNRQISLVIDESNYLTQFKSDMAFIRELQSCHDNAALNYPRTSNKEYDDEEWIDPWGEYGVAKNLQKFAIKYNLNATVLYSSFGYPSE